MMWRICATLFVFTSAFAFAQEDEAKQEQEPLETGFAGYVYSRSEVRPIPLATVRYADKEGSGASGKVTGDATGAYKVADIPPGTYALTVEADGFDTRTDADVIVVEGAVTDLDIGLTGEFPTPKGGRSFIAFALGGVVLLIVMTRSHMKHRRLLERRDDHEPRKPRRAETP